MMTLSHFTTLLLTDINSIKNPNPNLETDPNSISVVDSAGLVTSKSNVLQLLVTFTKK